MTCEQEVKTMDEDDAERERQPLRFRLPGFVKDEEIGLGDMLKRVTYAAGVKSCGGCEQRAATLNRWMVFSGKR
jgi:hypothetical protein